MQVAAATIAASIGLDVERSALYFDLIRASLSEAARKALQAMDRASYEYQSDFARRYFAEGRAEGRADLLLRLIDKRFGPLPEAAVARIRGASDEELERLADDVLTAATLEDLLT